jgi:hypothetical protein
MKKQLNSLIGLTVAATLAISSSFAQSEDMAFMGPAKSASANYVASPVSKNVKVDRAFAKNFINAKSITWKESADEYIANFKMEDRLAIAWFTKTGKLYCANYYGIAEHLPATEQGIIAEN